MIYIEKVQVVWIEAGSVGNPDNRVYGGLVVHYFNGDVEGQVRLDHPENVAMNLTLSDIRKSDLNALVAEAVADPEDGLLWGGGVCEEEPEDPLDCRRCGMRGCGWVVHKCREALRKLNDYLKTQEGVDAP